MPIFPFKSQNNVSNGTEIIDYIIALPPIIQLFIITTLLISSLMLYEAPNNTHNIHIITFITFRSIAFSGIVMDVYLFLKLIPVDTTKTEDNPIKNNPFKSEPFNRRFRPYHTPSRICSLSSIEPRSSSAPPVLNTLFPIKPTLYTSLPMAPILENDKIKNISASVSSHQSDEDVLYDMRISAMAKGGKGNNGYMTSMDIGIHKGVLNERNKENKMYIQRQTTNKQRLEVMMEKRKERDKLFFTETVNYKLKVRKDKNEIIVKRKHTRVDLKNETKLAIANHYLMNKRLNRNYSAKKCKMEFVKANAIDCGSVHNICNWSRNVDVIKDNIKRFGKDKMRNRRRQSLYHIE